MRRSRYYQNAGISWFNSLYTRTIVTFIVVLLPLYILGIFIYGSAVQIIRNEITSSIISQTTSYMDRLETEMQRLRQLQLDMVNDLYLNRLSAIPNAMNNIEQVQAILTLQNRINAISNSPYIRNFTVYIPTIGRIVTDRYVDELDSERFESLSMIFRQNELVVHENGDPVILFASPYLNNVTGEPMYIMHIELDKQAFRNALYQFNKYPGSGSFLVITGSNLNIATANITENIKNQIIESIARGGEGILPMETNNRKTLGMYIHVTSSKLGMTLVVYVPEDIVFMPIKQYQIWFYIFTLVAVAVLGLYIFSIYRFIHKPMMYLVSAFEKVEAGDMEVTIEHYHKDEFRYLYLRFNAMVENLGTLIRQVYTMKILTQKAELKQLQSQINPHFLYNSFFILHRRIKSGDYDNAIAFSQQLGDYFRFITRSADDEVLLMSEVEHAYLYAEIQRIRFSSRIVTEFGELPKHWKEVMVPRLILQPIIENAFEHGLENKVKNGLLRIAFLESECRLTVVVEDNGENLHDEELERISRMFSGEDNHTESTGIINIHKRLQLKFGKDCGIRILRSQLGGLRVELTITVDRGITNV